jgi:glutamate synthase (NADPH/NADH) large chain
MLVPEAWGPKGEMPKKHLDMFKYLGSVMEPWDGPAALAMTDGRWAVAGMDRNALRPLRYTQTSDGLLIVGSEAGMVVVPETMIVEKGRLGPGQMIAVDLDEGRLLHDREV